MSSKYGEKTIELTAQQERLWLAFKTQPENTSLNVAFNFKIQGKLDIKKFLKGVLFAFKSIPALRTVVVEEEKGAKQVILGKNVLNKLDFGYFVEFFDLYEKNKVKNYEMGLELNRARIRKRLDLLKFPISKAFLIRYDKTSFFFGFGSHHIFFDAFSAAIGIKIIQQFYNDELKIKSQLLLLKISGGMKDVEDYVDFYKKKVNRKTLRKSFIPDIYFTCWNLIELNSKCGWRQITNRFTSIFSCFYS